MTTKLTYVHLMKKDARLPCPGTDLCVCVPVNAHAVIGASARQLNVAYVHNEHGNVSPMVALSCTP